MYRPIRRSIMDRRHARCYILLRNVDHGNVQVYVYPCGHSLPFCLLNSYRNRFQCTICDLTAIEYASLLPCRRHVSSRNVPRRD